MPFQGRSIVSHREEFCGLAVMPGSNIRDLCRLWEISSATAYKWLRRFAAEGALGLRDRSRRPLGSPHCTSAAMEARVLAVRRAHPAWGGRKRDRRETGGQAATAVSRDMSFAGRNFCPDSEPSVPL